VSNPKKDRDADRERARQLSHEELQKQMGHVASDLLAVQEAAEEEVSDSSPAWIAPRQLVRILAPFVSMN
jgi:hypothetical protein